MNDLAVAPERDPEDDDNNPSANPSFDSVVQARVSRRQVLSGTAGVAAIAMLGGMKIETASAYGATTDHGRFLPGRSPRLGFTAVAKNLEDAVTIPRGYSYDVLYALGDPIARERFRLQQRRHAIRRQASHSAPAIITTASTTSVSTSTGVTTDPPRIAACCA